MDERSKDAAIDVVVVVGLGPRLSRESALRMPTGTTAVDAIRASGLVADLSVVDLDRLVLGAWGRKMKPQQLLRSGDRVELYRPLLVDPKVARQERFKRQGAKSAGLFSSRRPGAKAGY
jgi:putative ubiquitin-RnfH superfamily antitoxin RatB of RatAB toxin-antitoxin module